jgi:uncharacterized protein YwgA
VGVENMTVERKSVLMCLLRKACIVTGKTRFQKLVFLIQEEGVRLNYKFEPYHWGPLSFELQNDINTLVNQGIVVEYVLEFHGLSEEVRKRHDYQLSEWGKTYFDKVIQPKLPKNVDEAVWKVVKKWCSKSVTELLEHVHNRYPSYRLPSAHGIID